MEKHSLSRIFPGLFLAWIILPSQLGAASPWIEQNGFRYQELTPIPSAPTGFTSIPASQSGIHFTNELRGDSYLTNAVAHNGAGVAVGDVNGDGLPDIYLCGLDNPNHLYLNLGNWKFQDAPLEGAACSDQLSTGAALVDVDGDRDLDLLVNSIGRGTRLFLNDGKAHWTELLQSGLSTNASSTSIALADIDGDGDLDLYCTHFIDVMHLADPTTRFAIAKKGDRWEVSKVNGESARLPKWKDRFEALPDGKVRELPEYHALYRNDGTGHFTPILFEPGMFSDEQGKPIPPFRDWGLAAMFRDLNGDGFPDLYICNDNTSPDRIWINSGKGTFKALETSKLRHTSRSSMGVDFADIDRDGFEDFFVVDMLARDPQRRMNQLVRDRPNPAETQKSQERPQFNRNTLFFGRPGGFYVEAALMAGLAATDWTWTPIFTDIDLDGYEDLLVTNGFEFDVMDQDTTNEIKDPQLRKSPEELKRSMQRHPRFRTQNAAFRNQHDGTFKPMSQEWGFNHTGVSYGMAQGDFDNDGDMDIVINNLNEPASLLQNSGPGKRIQIRLRGQKGNSEAVGTRAQLIGGSLTQSQEFIAGGRYLSSDQPARVFAADPDTNTPMRLELQWRSGVRSTISNIVANRIYEIDEPAANSPNATPPAPPAYQQTAALFKDVSQLLNHSHIDEPLDDWSIQPTLPHRLTKLGPGLAWFDLNGDGWDDLIIAGGKNGQIALFQNQQGTRFERLSPPASLTTPHAQGAVIGWQSSSSSSTNTANLIAAINPIDPAAPTDSTLVNFSFNFDTTTPPQSGSAYSQGNLSVGPLAMADIDGDGDLDLFVGARFRKGRYPEPVSSSIWINNNGTFQISPEWSKALQDVGMCSGATFADLDGDGSQDLAIALSWGPIKVFQNQKNHFAEITKSTGLEPLTGCWTSIATGDFDGDGKLDLVAGNWGQNTIYQLYQPTPLRLYYGDWNGDGTLQIIEAWKSGDRWFPIHDRNWLARAFPNMTEQFPTYQSYSKATVQDLLGPKAESAAFLEAVELRSMVFLNRGQRFEPVPLPREAQLAPSFAVNVGDADGDGREDLFVSQNFFGTASDITREDGGQGLWLRGLGNGQFAALDSSTTGIRILGEQRAAALVDFNQDGRVDLAVTQNGEATRLFANQGAKPGLLILLQGPSSNPQAIGAEMRLMYSDGHSGPTRTVQCGSGYWSQNSSGQVLGSQDSPNALSIKWPTGKTQIFPLPKSEHVIRIPFPSK